MKNERIGDMLKKYRKMNSMTVADVVAQLQDRYNLIVAEKTVYGWESNQAHPTTDMFIVMCELYKINNLKEALNIDPESKYAKGRDFPITAEERSLIQRYREQPELQSAVRRVLNMDTEQDTPQ